MISPLQSNGSDKAAKSTQWGKDGRQRMVLGNDVHGQKGEAGPDLTP